MKKVLELVIEDSGVLKGDVVELGRINVISGFNATLKSIIARTIIYCYESTAEREFYSPTLRDLDVKYSLSLDPCKCRRYLIADNRIILRSLYKSQHLIRDILESLGNLGDRITSLARDLQWIRDEIESIRDKFVELRNSLGYYIIEDIVDLKSRVSPGNIYMIYDIFKKALREISEKLKDTDASENDIYPLEITSIRRDKYLASLRIRDRRTGSFIESRYYSTSIIAPLLFEFLINFLAYSEEGIEAKILVIEEPEESLTPIQQILLTRFLNEAVNKSVELSGNETVIIMTTHSPYIAYSVDPNNSYNYFVQYDSNEKKFRIMKSMMHRSFVLADLFMLG